MEIRIKTDLHITEREALELALDAERIWRNQSEMADVTNLALREWCWGSVKETAEGIVEIKLWKPTAKDGGHDF